MAKAKSPVRFYYQDPGARVRNAIKLRRFVEFVFHDQHKQLQDLTYIFCTDRYLLDINRKFLDHDYYTDVISFNLAEPSAPVIGEIYISMSRVRENALELGQPFHVELSRVIFHGALHLCGHTDKTSKAQTEMKKMEDYYLLRYDNSSTWNKNR